MNQVKLNCFSCHKEIARDGNIPRRDECEFCGADLHVCKNCQFYDKGSYNECRESSADVVQEKERANFCDFFVPVVRGAVEDLRKQQLAAAEALFKK